MFNKFSIISIHVSLLLLETTSNLIQPEYSIKIFNTENVIFSLGDIDDDTDLEIVKNKPQDSLLEKKLHDFHKYVNIAVKTERPKERGLMPHRKFYKALLMPQTTYPDSPYEIAVDDKHLSMLERREKKRKKMKKIQLKFPLLPEMDTNTVQKKRELPKAQASETYEEYDYMTKDYLNYLEQSQNNSKLFRYSDEGKPEESVKDVVSKIMDLKTPKNCINVTGIGVQRMECIFKNFQEGVFDQTQMIYALLGVILVWVCIYLVIALPLWCIRGWCCCCCRCSFCYPVETVRMIQTYVAHNPPGTYRNSRGEKVAYMPSQRENELYEKIRRSISEF